jgi:hypothetical protein
MVNGAITNRGRPSRENPRQFVQIRLEHKCTGANPKCNRSYNCAL